MSIKSSQRFKTAVNETFFEIKGVPTDGVTDAAPAINNALQYLGNLLRQGQDLGQGGPTTAFLKGGTYLINSKITVPIGITLKGETMAPPYPNRLSGFRSNQNMLTGTEIICSDTFTDEYAIELAPDNTNVENIILDGHFIPAGTVWTQVNVTTAQGRWLSTAFIKFPVNDSEDKRIQSFGFDNIEIPYFRVGENMQFQLQGIGGLGVYTISLLEGSLPAGLSLSNEGLISGTATDLEITYPKFQITDGTNTFDRVFTMGTIFDEIKTRDISPPTVGVAYSFQFETRYAESSVTWSASGLPEWLSLSSTGLLTNNRTTIADDVEHFSFKVSLYHTNGTLLDKRYYYLEIRYADGSIRIHGEQTLKPETGVPFSYIYPASGGYGDYTWSINSARTNSEYPGNTTTTTDTSPFTGLTLNQTTGEITGTVTSTGRNTYYLRATSNVDTSIFFEALFYMQPIEGGETPRILTRSFKTAQKGTPYNFQFNVEDIPSAKPYTYTAINLPTGLSMDTNGLITGTPTGSVFTHGVRIQWSDSVKNCTIRGFRNGAGIYSVGASNVHRIHGCLISVCDAGIGSVNQTWDSHFSDLYIFNCRVGMDLGPGSAGLSVWGSRIEYIHEDGVSMRTANENDFSAIYFDTCGWSSIRAVDSRNLLVTGCRFFRSGRNLRGIGVQFDPKANRDYSNHVYLESCKRSTFTGNTFDIGTKDSGDGLYLSDHWADNLRPYVGFRIYDTPELTIVGNNLTGCVNNAYDANLTDFGSNDYHGYNIKGNVQTDKQMVPIHPSEKDFIIPNNDFKVWQRDNKFIIPPATSATAHTFEIADFWTLKRGGNAAIDQSITCEQRTTSTNQTYLHLEKPLNTTAPTTNNFQTLELYNRYGKDLSLTSNRAVIISWYARSSTNTTLGIKVSQYADSSDNSFAAYQFQDNGRTIINKWKRYQYYVELEDLSGVTFGDGAVFNIIFRCDKWDEQIDLDIYGIQVDFVDKVPFATELRTLSFEEELAWAKTKYQKSKAYDQYFGSWSTEYRYDANGANWQPGYVIAYSPDTSPANLKISIPFEVPLEKHPGFADGLGGVIPTFKILNPAYIVNRVQPDKYTLSGTNNPDSYIEDINTKGFTVSGRNSGVTTAADSTYAFHWIYSNYEQDYAPGGGYA